MPNGVHVITLYGEDGSIGMEFGIEFEGDERFVIIERFVRINKKKGPAEREKKLKKGMVVLEVNEEPTSMKSADEVAKMVDLQVRARMPVTFKVAKKKQAKILTSMVDRPTSVKKTLCGDNFKQMIAAGASTEEIAAYMKILMRGGGGTAPSKPPAAAAAGGGGSRAAAAKPRRAAPKPPAAAAARRAAPKRPATAAARRRAAPPTPQILNSFRKPNKDEFVVDIPLGGSKQLGMDLKVSPHGLIQISDFYQASDGATLPVEKHGEILEGDFIVSVNDERFKNYDDCKVKLAAAARAGGTLALGVLPKESAPSLITRTSRSQSEPPKPSLRSGSRSGSGKKAPPPVPPQKSSRSRAAGRSSRGSGRAGGKRGRGRAAPVPIKRADKPAGKKAPPPLPKPRSDRPRVARGRSATTGRRPARSAGAGASGRRRPPPPKKKDKKDSDYNNPEIKECRDEIASLQKKIKEIKMEMIDAVEAEDFQALDSLKTERGDLVHQVEDETERLNELIEECKEAERKAAEEEARRKAEEEARRKKEEEARRKREEEARRKREEAARRKKEEEARRKKEEEARRKKEEEARRKKEEAEAKRRKDAALKRRKEGAARRRKEEAARRAEEEAEEEAARLAEEEAARLEEEEAARLEEEEAARLEEEEAAGGGGDEDIIEELNYALDEINDVNQDLQDAVAAANFMDAANYQEQIKELTEDLKLRMQDALADAIASKDYAKAAEIQSLQDAL